MEIREDVIKRLATFGYTVDEEKDDWVLGFLLEKVGNDIKISCNISEIPPALREVYVDMVCGEFMQMKKGTGQLDSIDVSSAVKQIKEGDTSITYAVVDGAITTLDGLIYFLMNAGRGQFASFRKLRW